MEQQIQFKERVGRFLLNIVDMLVTNEKIRHGFTYEPLNDLVTVSHHNAKKDFQRLQSTEISSSRSFLIFGC
jgi:hypothetical protein